MSQAGIRKKGYLLKLPVTGIVKKWAKRWCVLYGTSHEGVVRIEYYIDENSERSQIGKRTIPLRDCSKIQQCVGDKIRPYVFEFTTQLGQHVFAADNNPELDEWLDGIKDAVHEDRMKRKMNKTQTKKATATTSAPPGPSSQTQSSNSQPKAIGYAPVQAKGFSKGSTHTASSITSGTYRITLEENETTDELDLHGSFNLVLAPTSIAIVDVDTGKPIYKWHYKYLKSFGKQSGRFNFEVGKTPQGVGGTGSYRCITTCSKEIFGVVNRNIKTIRERMGSERKEQPQKNTQHSRNSGVVDETVPGKYRSSRNMEQVGAAIGEPLNQQDESSELTEKDIQNNYSLAEGITEPPDISDLYAKVNKPPKGGATPTSQPEQQQQQTSTGTADAQPTNRFSYDNTLDTRDSALIQLDGPLLDLEALTPKKPTPDLSNVMDIDLNDEFFTQATATAATGVDPWGGGQTASSDNMQNPWGMQSGGVGDGGQQFTSYGQSTGYGQFSGYGQPTGYGQPVAAYGKPMPGQGMQSNQWGMMGQGQHLAGFEFQPASQQLQQPQAPQKALSQQEFDQLWDELCASTTNF